MEKLIKQCTMDKSCAICDFNDQCARRVKLLGQVEVSDIAKLSVAHGRQWAHPRTRELMITPLGITLSGKKLPAVSQTGSPKIAHNRKMNQQLVKGRIIVSDNSELEADGFLKNKPTAQWEGVWTITKRKRIIGGHSWFDSNPNRK